MSIRVGMAIVIVISAGMVGWANEVGQAVAEVGTVLDSFHQAASEADGDTYFNLLADNAVFLGTDIAERWTVDEFREFAEPYFSQGRGWTYTMTERHVYIADGGKTAWFDEILANEGYGNCRGTGALILTEEGWRIVQYHLTFPIPNELAKEFTARIKDFEASRDP